MCYRFSEFYFAFQRVRGAYFCPFAVTFSFKKIFGSTNHVFFKQRKAVGAFFIVVCKHEFLVRDIFFIGWLFTSNSGFFWMTLLRSVPVLGLDRLLLATYQLVRSTKCTLVSAFSLLSFGTPRWLYVLIKGGHDKYVLIATQVYPRQDANLKNK